MIWNGTPSNENISSWGHELWTAQPQHSAGRVGWPTRSGQTLEPHYAMISPKRIREPSFNSNWINKNGSARPGLIARASQTRMRHSCINGVENRSKFACPLYVCFNKSPCAINKRRSYQKNVGRLCRIHQEDTGSTSVATHCICPSKIFELSAGNISFIAEVWLVFFEMVRVWDPSLRTRH